MLSVYGDVAELVDALASKSCFLRKCEFESHHPYQNEKPWIYPRLFLLYRRILLNNLTGINISIDSDIRRGNTGGGAVNFV